LGAGARGDVSQLFAGSVVGAVVPLPVGCPRLQPARRVHLVPENVASMTGANHGIGWPSVAGDNNRAIATLEPKAEGLLPLSVRHGKRRDGDVAVAIDHAGRDVMGCRRVPGLVRRFTAS